MKSQLSEHVKQFEHARKSYEAFEQKITLLIRELLELEKIKYHIVESRTKTIDSYISKISRPSKSYSSPLSEITDLVGIRIILYYTDDIPTVSDILSKHFSLIENVEEHNVEKMDDNKFGYLSTHLILKSSENRSKLPDWSSYKSFVFEVQVRTVLQHAWAAVSHSLNYKNEANTPKTLRRRLNRVAGLFELADDEFIQLRILRQAQNKIDIKKLSQGDEETPLTLETVSHILDTKEYKQTILKQAREAGFIFKDDPNYLFQVHEDDIGDERYIQQIIEICEKHSINTLSQFERILKVPATGYYSDLINSERRETQSEWHSSLGFSALLQFMRIRPDKVKKSAKSQWSEEILEDVLFIAKKHEIDLTIVDKSDF